jgi:GNAT superfamily N-acetyltransferase
MHRRAGVDEGPLRIEQVGYGHPDATRLIDEVQLEYAARYGTPDEGPIDPLMFDPPHGSFFVGYVGDTPVATGAWRRRPVEAFGTSVTAEIKRMYVVPAARGRGHARRVLTHLEETALASGIEAMILETGLRQPEAIALYESAGYTSIPAFGHYRDSPVCRCFGRPLRSRRDGAPAPGPAAAAPPRTPAP